MYLQPHYGNVVFDNVYFFAWTTLIGKHCQHPIGVMGVVDTFGHRRAPARDFTIVKETYLAPLCLGLLPGMLDGIVHTCTL